MRFRLTPEGPAFFDMFATSAATLVRGIQAASRIFLPDADRSAVADEVRRIEHEADEITHGILRRLNSTFVTRLIATTFTGSPAGSTTSWTLSRPAPTSSSCTG